MELASISGVRAVLFDMDGTLIQSEDRTDRAVASLLTDYGVPLEPEILASFHGVTWAASGARAKERWPELRGVDVAAELQRLFHATFVTAPPPQVPGAREAVRAAAAVLPCGLVTSSNRATLELVCDQLDLRGLLAVTVGAEDYACSKPAPEPYQVAAERLGVDPARCLVFEDSEAGLRAARTAGATVIAVGARRDLPWIADFHDLPPGFFARAGGAGAQ